MPLHKITPALTTFIQSIQMNKLYALAMLTLSIAIPARSQTAADYAVQLNVTTQTTPPQIKLQWKKLSPATSYTVSRKAKEDFTWTTLATLTAADSTYSDNTVVVDSAYEYKVAKAGGTNAATGYIYAAIKAPAIHNRGTMVLLVDSNFRDSCKAEIADLMSDLRADGWALVRHDIGRSAPVNSVRSIIQSDYATYPAVSSLYLLGHIPVPYSGNLAPDGHVPDHEGAWPADGYYADVDGTWTDNIVNTISASQSRTRNIPGDGKWDPTFLPSPVDLQTGRVDFASMPAITRTEIQLMRSYLTKAHRYKADSLTILHKAVIDDNFGGFSGEAFAANGWRSYSALVGSSNIYSGDLETTLHDSAYQWAYGCGAGSYTTAAGIGASSDFNSKNVKGIFTMFFGSYFGDWDAQSTFLRAPLCAVDPALTSTWTGRPNWFFHHMALGESIGYSTRISQNNTNLYDPSNYGAGFVHVALMGDPTLRTDYIQKPQALTVMPVASAGANLTWTASPDASVIGYYIYRSDSTWGTYSRVSPLLSSTSFTDNKGSDGKKYYMVRSVKLQPTPSGSYYNLGLGIVDSAQVSFPLSIAENKLLQNLVVYPNPAGFKLNVIVELSTSKTAAIQIVNASGSLIHTDNTTLHAGTNSLSWDITKYAPGFYTIVLRTDEGTTVRKWTKIEGR
jgi:hypothetical protein